MPPKYWSQALSGLSKQDPVLKVLIRSNRKKELHGRSDPFVTLARAIISQQISVKAAAAIWQRLLNATGSIKPDSMKLGSMKPGFINTASVEPASNKSSSLVPGPLEFASIRPDAIAQMNIEQLRECGLSGRKSTYLVELANCFLNGSLDTEDWRLRDDEQLINELTKLKGIGRWTAEMFLIFFMLRPNVLPIGDIGLQRAMRRHYNKGEPLSIFEMRQIAENWQPWCTVATWFMWRSLDPPAGK
jgi:DNA-3-methyladenine glycosylase II